MVITRTSGRGAEDLAHELGSRLEKVLAVVDEEQEPPLPQVRQQDLDRLRSGLVSEVQGCEHGVGHEGRIA